MKRIIPSGKTADWAILLPGFLCHAFCVWSAYRAAKNWVGY